MIFKPKIISTNKTLQYSMSNTPQIPVKNQT